MSLIFSALSEMEKQSREGQAAHAPNSGLPSSSLRSERKQWPVVLAGVVALGLVGFFLGRSMSPAGSVASSPTPVITKATAPLLPISTTTSATVGAADIVTNETPILPVTTTAPTAAVTTSATVISNVVPIVPLANVQSDAAVPVSIPAASPTISSQPAVVDSSVVPSVVQQTPREVAASAKPQSRPDRTLTDSNNFIKLGKQPAKLHDQDVSHWVDAFTTAMASGNHELARAHLAKIQAQLSPQSITLLRMQAWYAVDTGDDNGAREFFAGILSRVPEDENAGVNSALIDWRAGRQDAALARMTKMHQQFPDSPLVSQNWQAMHDQRQ